MNTVIERDIEEDLKSRQRTDFFIFYLLLLCIGFLPLIVQGDMLNYISPLITSEQNLTSGSKGDLFASYKVFLLKIVTVIVLFLFLYKIFILNDIIRKSKINIFIMIFLVGILLSTYFSPSISIALYGQADRLEGALTYICYLVLFFISLNIEYPKHALKYILYSLYPFVIINFTLVILNLYGIKILELPFLQKILLFNLNEDVNLGGYLQIVGTLNQWNYMSGMFAIMTLLFLFASIIENKKTAKIAHFIIAILSVATMLVSISTSGFLTLLLTFPFILLYIWKNKLLQSGSIILILFVIVSAPALHILSEKNPRIWSESIGYLINHNPYEIRDESSFLNGNSDTAFASAPILELPKLPERGDAALTSRIYIWEKSFELIEKRPLLGYGLDTFMYHFPHYNIDARAGIWDETVIVDKPHNMYIGLLYGTGIIGFVGFLLISGSILIITIKSLFSKQNSVYIILGIVWIAFLIQGLVNDSIPGIGIPLWILGGIALKFLSSTGNQLEHEQLKIESTNSMDTFEK